MWDDARRDSPKWYEPATEAQYKKIRKHIKGNEDVFVSNAKLITSAMSLASINVELVDWELDMEDLGWTKRDASYMIAELLKADKDKNNE